jgi:hypothetical protein
MSFAYALVTRQCAMRHGPNAEDPQAPPRLCIAAMRHGTGPQGPCSTNRTVIDIVWTDAPSERLALFLL